MSVFISSSGNKEWDERSRNVLAFSNIFGGGGGDNGGGSGGGIRSSNGFQRKL